MRDGMESCGRSPSKSKGFTADKEVQRLKQHIKWIKKNLYLPGIAILLLASLAACSQDSSAGGSTTTPGGPPIVIGYSYSTSGDFGDDGKAMNQGYQLWAQTVNNSGGILGRPVQLDVLQDNSDPQKVANNYKTLITQKHVNLLFGPFSSLLTKAVIPVAAQYGYALPEGSGGGTTVFTENDQYHDVAFDVSLPVSQNLVSFAYYILSLPPANRPKTVAYATENDPFTLPQIQAVQKILRSADVQQVYYKEYDGADAKAYVPTAQAVAQANADIVVLGTVLPDAAAFINTFKQEHYNPKALVATAGPDGGQQFVHAVGLPATEAVFVPNGWYPAANNFQNALMVQDYLAQYGGTANSINADVAEAYSVGQVVQQAIEKTGSIDNAAIIQRLRQETFDTVQGAVQFDSHGQNLTALSYLFQWQKGAFLPVFPPTVAVQNPVYPRPSVS